MLVAAGCSSDGTQAPADGETSATTVATSWEPSTTSATGSSGTQSTGDGDSSSTGPDDTTGTGGEPPDGPRDLEPFQAIPTVNAADIEAFEIEGETYLAVANYYDLTTFNLDSEILVWNGEAFESAQTIPTSGAYAFEHFTVGEDHFLAVANYYDDLSYATDSVIYRFEGDQFVQDQTIPTQGAFDVEAFSLGAESWLAFANEVALTDDLYYDQNSRLYRHNGDFFVEFQTIPTHGAHDITHFRIGTDDVLAVAQYYQDGFVGAESYRPPSELYRWHSSTVGFAAWTSVPGNGAFDWEFFEIDGQPMLFLANSIDGITFDIDSVLYRFEDTGLQEVQRIPTHDATAAEAFFVGGEQYLAISNAATGDNLVSSHVVDSVVLRWVDGAFVEHQALPTLGAYDVEHFAIGQRDFLAVANSYDGVEVELDSVIYELVPAGL